MMSLALYRFWIRILLLLKKQNPRSKMQGLESRIQDPRSPVQHFISFYPVQIVLFTLIKKIAEDSYIDWLVKYDDITAGKHAIVTRCSRCTRLPRTAQCWMFDPSTRLRHALPRDNKAACSYIKLVRVEHWPCILLFLRYCSVATKFPLFFSSYGDITCTVDCLRKQKYDRHKYRQFLSN